MSSWLDDYNIPTMDSVGGSDLFSVFSQENGAKRNVSANNVRTFMQDGFALPNGILSISSIYEMYQPSTLAQYNTTLAVAFPLNLGLAVRQFSTTANSIIVDNATGGFILNRDCQAVYVNACVQHTVTSTISHSYVLTAKVEGTSTYQTPLKVSSTAMPVNSESGVSLSGVICNPNNSQNMLKKGEVIRFYLTRYSGATSLAFNCASQYFSVQTLDGV